MRLKIGIIFSVCMAVFLTAGMASALDLVVVPETAQRQVGNPVRVQIWAENASAIISMGIKVSFDPAVLQATGAAKNEDFSEGFLMDADGDSGTTDDQYVTPLVEIDNTAGTVTMIGGRLIGDSTTGLGPEVLLGWIDFNPIANGSTNVSVDLAHNNTTFVNFAGLPSGDSQDPGSLPANLGWIYVGADACEADYNADFKVDAIDADGFRNDFGDTTCLGLGNICLADMNGDGKVDAIDADLFRGDFGRTETGSNSCPQP